MPDIQSQPDLSTQSAVALIEDTLSGIEFGMALMDEDLNFVLFNEKYAELSFDAAHHPKIGENAADLALAQLQAGRFVIPDALDPSEMRAALVDAVKSCQPDIRLERTDGRMLSASAKRTQLGGYLVTVMDITDRIRAEEAERRRWDAIAAVVGALDEGFSLWDADMNLIMCNDQYMRDVAGYRDTPFQPGMTGREVMAEVHRSGTFVMSDDLSTEEFVERLLDLVRNYAGPIDFELKDGRRVVGTAKATSLGGYLITTRDVTDRKRAEEAERRRMETIATVVGALDEGFALWDDDMRFVMCNDQYMKDVAGYRDIPFEVGMTAEQALEDAYNSGTFVIPDGVTLEEFSSQFVSMVRNYAKGVEIEFTDGRTVVATSKRTELGGYLVTVADITDRLRADQAERRRWDTIETIVGALDEGFSLWDADMRFIMCNDQYMRDVASYRDTHFEVGTTAEDAIAAGYDAGIFAMSDELSREDYVEEFMTWARTYAGPIEVVVKDGRIVIATVKETELGGYLITSRDVTEERNSEERARALLYDATEALEEGFSLWDADMNFLMCNQKYVEIVLPFRGTPFPVGTSIPDSARELFASGMVPLPEHVDVEAVIADIEHWARTFGPPREYHLTDGRVVRTSIKPTKLGGFLVTAVDLTKERDSEARARALVYDAMESLEEGFALWDADMKFLMCNQKHVEIVLPFRNSPFPVGTTVEEGARETVMSGMVDLPEGADPEALVADIVDWTRSYGPPREFHMTDGRVIKASVQPTKLGGFLVTSLDLTKERDAQENRLRAIADAMQRLSNAIVLYDADLNYVMSNELHDEFWFEGSGIEHPHVGENLSSVIDRLLEADYMLLPEGMSRKAHGDAMLEATRNFEKGVTLEAKTGTMLANVNQTGLGGYLIEMTNVTEQLALTAELEQQRETAHQNEKLSALGELLAGVAHELNNPLSVVFGYSQMLQGKIKDPVLSERVDLICQSSERAAKIVRTFLSMARQRPTKMQLCEINDIVETALEVSSYSLKSNGTQVSVVLDQAMPTVMGDFDQLAQVFSNLIVNAGHAVSSKGAEGRITLKTRVKADLVEVEIADNGYGIPKALQSRIFEPFFTTKDVGEGTGIGLAFSHRIVKSHDGTLTLRSQPDTGTRFFVTLSLSQGVTEQDAPMRLQNEGGLTALVLDDEEGVARLISDMLAEESFQVTTMTDPNAALRLAEQQTFDVVLSDFKMPQMTGEVFYRALMAIAPENAGRIGFVTGDALSSEVAQFLATSRRPHIEKPIVKQELMGLIARATNRARPWIGRE